jgi:hypothetical protein
METILITNAISMVIAAAGFGGYLGWARRRARRAVAVRPLYVEARAATPFPARDR